MENLRKYGGTPYTVAVIHGGPGAPGMMAPVARELSHIYGVLEPLQTSASIEGEIKELKVILENYGHLPVTLVGHSWGAWLSIIFTAGNPGFVKKLILIGCPPLEENYASNVMVTRLNRLDENERLKAIDLMGALNDPGIKNKDIIFAQFGKLMTKADTLDAIPHGEDKTTFQEDIYRRVWREAEELRRTGKLLEMAEAIQCPVVAIHGDYDPHPAEGVEKPLCKVVKDFRFILLKRCGHEPWNERAARDNFFEALKKAI